MGSVIGRPPQRGGSQQLLFAATVGAAAVMLAGCLVRRGGRPALVLGEQIQFAHLRVGPEKVLAQSRLSVALSGLQPILPGHIVVVPRRVVARLADLSDEEVVDLAETARIAQGMLKGTAFNWAVKDGPAAGQPVPHAHLHVVPRQPKDLPANDLVYEMIDRWSPVDGEVNVPPPLDFPSDDQRRARTEEEMAAEARRYAERAGASSGPLPTQAVQFGKFSLRPTQVFYKSTSGLSFATVNLKPLVPGHILVVPTRVVPTIGGLTRDELVDLFHTVRRVQTVVLDCHRATCANLGMQDGRDAGQSVPHVHVHVLPRGGGPASSL